jgi:hypothetical protein
MLSKEKKQTKEIEIPKKIVSPAVTFTNSGIILRFWVSRWKSQVKQSLGQD